MSEFELSLSLSVLWWCWCRHVYVDMCLCALMGKGELFWIAHETSTTSPNLLTKNTMAPKNHNSEHLVRNTLCLNHTPPSWGRNPKQDPITSQGLMSGWKHRKHSLETEDPSSRNKIIRKCSSFGFFSNCLEVSPTPFSQGQAAQLSREQN